MTTTSEAPRLSQEDRINALLDRAAWILEEMHRTLTGESEEPVTPDKWTEPN